MAGWLFKRKSQQNPEECVTLEAGDIYTPLQVSGDTFEHPSLDTLPTLGKLLNVEKGDKFILPSNELVQWLLVEREHSSEFNRTNSVTESSETSSGYSEPSSGYSEPSSEDLNWGFIPKKCLSDKSISYIESKCTLCGKHEQLKQDHNLMVLKLAKMEQQLHEALEKNKTLQEKLVEKGELIEQKKIEIKDLTEKLNKEEEKTKSLYKEVEFTKRNSLISTKQEDETESELDVLSSTNDEMQYDDSIEEIETGITRRCSVTPITELMLCCTLCQEKISVRDMEAHSIKCSSGTKSRNGESPTLSDGLLISTITCSLTDSYCPETAFFRIISKTTIPEYKRSLLLAERTLEDIKWLHKALEDLHPERVIPPIILCDDLTTNLREMQIFLSRICYHKVFKNEPLIRSFLSSDAKDLAKLKSTFEKKCPTYLPRKKPAIEVTDTDGLLCRTQVYIAKFIENINEIIEYLKDNKKENFIDNFSTLLLSLSQSEPNETYLKNVSNALSNMIGELQNKKNLVYDESVFIEDLESILQYSKAADELLYRVECSINTFLYWEEEVKVFEEMKEEGLVTTTNGKDITHKWAEASQNCRRAKQELEHMCKNLSEELTSFDIRKEQEIKQIFTEFAQSRCDIFEKLKSKWFGVKLMMDIDIINEVRAIDFQLT